MSQHYFSKSALALSLIVAGLASASLAQEDENTTGLTSVTAPTLEAPSTTEEVTEDLAPIENTTKTPIATSLENPPTPNTTLVTPVEGQTVDIRIASTTDLHTNLVNYDYYQDKEAQNIGLSKTAVLLKKAKAENPNVVIVDNGDLIQGTPLGTYKAIIDKVEPGE
nr:hypothetical protein [Streptococcus sp. S784/96/1]